MAGTLDLLKSFDRHDREKGFRTTFTKKPGDYIIPRVGVFGIFFCFFSLAGSIRSLDEWRIRSAGKIPSRILAVLRSTGAAPVDHEESRFGPTSTRALTVLLRLRTYGNYLCTLLSLSNTYTISEFTASYCSRACDFDAAEIIRSLFLHHCLRYLKLGSLFSRILACG